MVLFSSCAVFLVFERYPSTTSAQAARRAAAVAEAAVVARRRRLGAALAEVAAATQIAALARGIAARRRCERAGGTYSHGL